MRLRTIFTIILNIGATICVTVSSAQEVCTEDFECEGENTQCLLKYVGCSIGTCECRYGYFRTDTNSTCIPERHHGEHCDTTEQCSHTVDYMHCIDNWCQCVEGESVYYRENGDAYCYKALLYDDCITDFDCLAYKINSSRAECFDGRCGCLEEYWWTDDQECVGASMNFNCDTIVCKEPLICLEDDTCGCPDNLEYDYSQEICIHEEAQTGLNPGDECNLDYTLSSGLICDSAYICDECADANGTFCMDPRIDRCFNDSQCLATNSSCYRPYPDCEAGICQCEEGYYRESSQTCRLVSDLDTDCDTDADCDAHTHHSVCNEVGVCTCLPGEQVYTDDASGRSYCYRSLPGEQCTADTDCLSYRIAPNTAECVVTKLGPICHCKQELVLHGVKCEPADFEEYCATDGVWLHKECIGETSCDSEFTNQCQCSGTHFWSYHEESCIYNIADYDRAIGQSCNVFSRCNPWLSCVQCPWDYSETCQATHGDIDYCTEHDECPDENSRCFKQYEDCDFGKCQCLEGYYMASEHLCKLERNLGESCDSTEDCRNLSPFSHCNEEYICSCHPGESFYHHEGKDYCYVYDVGDTCVDLSAHRYGCLAYRLSPDYGNCYQYDGDDDYVCQCSEYTMSVDGVCSEVPYQERCDLSDGGEKYCADTLECLPDGSIKSCLCEEDSTWREEHGRCVDNDAEMNRDIGEECNTQYDSSVGELCLASLECSNCGGEGHPTCHQPRGGIDSICEFDQDCLPNNAVCVYDYEGCQSGSCQCSTDYASSPHDNMLCEKVAYIDDPCTSRSQCDAGVAYSWCSVEGLCECGNNEEVFETEERSYCYKSRADEFCFYPDECLSFRIDPRRGDCKDNGLCGCLERYVLIDEACVPVPYGQSCEIDGVDKDCIRDSYCDYITKTCVCPEGSTWMEGYLNCVHDGAVHHLDVGNSCNDEIDSASGLLCEPALVCDACPEEVGNSTCQETRQQNTLYKLPIQ